jgi:hypothetical protein
MEKTIAVSSASNNITTSTYTTPHPGYFYCNDWSGSELRGIIMNSLGSEVFHITAKGSATAIFLRAGVKIKTSAAPNTSQQAVFYYNNNE